MEYKSEFRMFFKNHWKSGVQFPVFKFEIDRFYGVKLFTAILGFSVCFFYLSKNKQQAWAEMMKNIDKTIDESEFSEIDCDQTSKIITEE